MTPQPSRPQRSRRGIGFTVLATLAIAASAFTGSALAAPGSGQVTLSLTAKGGEGTLMAQGVKVTYSAKAGKTGATKSASASHDGKGKSASRAVSLPVADLELLGGATIRTAGNLKLASGKRRATLRDISLQSGGEQTAISARLGKRRLVVFRASGAPTVGKSSANLTKAPLTLTGNGASALRQRLGLDVLSPGRQGTLGIDALLLQPVAEQPKATQPEKEPTPIDLDPYFQQCGVTATSEVAGSLPDPESLPPLTDSKATVTPTEVHWGFRPEFRGYVIGGAGGSLHALDGATRDGAGPVAGFVFPVTTGEYASNDPIDMTDDEAVIDGAGTALFCGTAHKFRVAISNPTVVIDGADSRIVADLDANLNSIWIPTQRIDLAALDLDGVTPFYNLSGSQVSWGEIPATLTEAGADAICGGDPICQFQEGTALESIDVAVNTPYVTGAGGAAAWDALATYVADELPFPLADATLGGCTLPTPAGGNDTQARTIDEHLDYGGSAAAWNPDGSRPAAEPDLSGGTALSGGNFDWGVRRGLRGSLNFTGMFNLAGGATASNPYYGNGGALVSPPSQMSNTTAQPSKYFRWSSTGGSYKANGAGSADDQLLLRAAGRVGLCQTGTDQWYGIVLSDPTIVIDGANSRVTIDVATRYRLSWVRARVDLARFDLTDPGASFTTTDDAGTTTVEWKFTAANETVVPNAGPVKLTAAGESVINMIGPTLYEEGLGLDAAAIKAAFPTPAP